MASGDRPPHWARPLSVKGVPNFHRVSAVLYRSAQPTDSGFKALRTLGMKTVVNLRSFHADRKTAEAAGLWYVHITMKAWQPEETELIRFLNIVTAPDAAPVLVHCQRGADRTGTMCAVYRIVFCGWTKEEALEEMTKGGFGFNRLWINLRRYIAELDTADLRSKVRAQALPR